MNKQALPTTDLGFVIDVIEEMQKRAIISDYAIGGAVAAILHAEPISTVDLDIFFFLTEQRYGSLEHCRAQTLLYSTCNSHGTGK